MILITGANGFVGKAFTSAMKKKYPDEKILIPSSKELDLMKYSEVEDYIKRERVNTVFHLAARLGGVGLVSNRPRQFLEDNLLINYNIVHAALSANVEKFITLGSSCSYSECALLPTDESQLWKAHPENTYGVCKLILLEHLKNQNKMEWVYLIPPNIYGSGDHFGEDNAHFIPATVQKVQNAIRNNEMEIEVWGDGKQTRDFVYIDDIVHFLLEAYVDRSYDGKPINVSTAKEVSICEIVEMILEYMGVKDTISIRWAPEKPTGSKRKVLSNKQLLEIAPDYHFTDIFEGLKKTLQFTIEKGDSDGYST